MTIGVNEKILLRQHPISWMSSVLKIGHIATAMLPLFMPESIS